MGKNFQDVIRDVYNEPSHALQTTGSGATIFAVVNTGAASDSVLNIGFATVSVSNPTLYAVVNTGAAGVGNSIVTVANPNFGINAGVNGIGFVTVSVVNQPALVAGAAYVGLATVDIGTNNTVKLGTNTLNIGSVSILGGVLNTVTAVTDITNPIALKGNVTLSDSKTYIGLTTTTIGNSPVLGSGVGNIGFATIANALAWPDPKTYIGLVTITGSLSPAAGNVTITDGKTFIGSVSVTGTVGLTASTLNIGSVSVLGGGIGINTGLNNIGFATVAISTPTLFAVVNTGSATDPKIYIGLVTNTIGSMPSVLASGQYFPTLQSVASGALAPLAIDATGELLLGNTNKYIGLVSVSGVVGLQASTLDIGSVSVLGGTINSTLQSSTLNVGSVSILGGSLVANLNTGTLNIGSVSILGGKIVNDTSTLNIGSVSVLGGTIAVSSLPALVASTVNIGSVSILGGKIINDTSTLNIGSVSILGGVINTNLNTGTLNIGSVSILGGTLKLAEPNAFIGLVTSVNGAGTQFIGLVTAWTRNAGSAKTLLNLPITGLSKAGSIATIAVPTNAQTMYITNFVINSDATVNVRIKSGVTYMNGNASLGITLNPGGGFIMSGSPDSPSWIGLPSGAIVIEKFDMTGTIANLGGNLVYFQE